ncbi:hypothetical protein [Dactylosporangium sp. NPDC051541]|uniref:hypothetical protein n=1 Tax=Dactylosporangium sp. NPDC051541 TaxID=3363977 RepID=UPI0037A8AB48
MKTEVHGNHRAMFDATSLTSPGRRVRRVAAATAAVAVTMATATAAVPAGSTLAAASYQRGPDPAAATDS